jgi:hypothetical protein
VTGTLVSNSTPFTVTPKVTLPLCVPGSSSP